MGAPRAVFFPFRFLGFAEVKGHETSSYSDDFALYRISTVMMTV